MTIDLKTVCYAFSLKKDLMILDIISHLCYFLSFFGNFCGHFIFANSVKRHICDVKNSRLGHDLPTSVNDRVILPCREDFIFTKLRICAVSQK